MLHIQHESDCERVANNVIDFWRVNQDLMYMALSKDLSSDSAHDYIKKLKDSDTPLVKSLLTNRTQTLKDLDDSIEYIKQNHKLAFDQLGENKYRNFYHGLLLIKEVIEHELFEKLVEF